MRAVLRGTAEKASFANPVVYIICIIRHVVYDILTREIPPEPPQTHQNANSGRFVVSVRTTLSESPPETTDEPHSVH